MLPKEGWIYKGMLDLKNATGACDLCGTAIRFEHFLYHPDRGELTIGCECAKHLMNGDELDYIKGKDKQMREAARREKALRAKWEERNAYYAKRNLPTITWEEYRCACEKNQKGDK